MLTRSGIIFIILAILSGIVPAFAQEETAVITAEVIYPTTIIYATPSTGAPHIGSMAQGEQMTILQREGAYEGEWVRITAHHSGITGWVDVTDLYLSDDQWKRFIPELNSYDLRNPAYVENDTLPLPLIAETSWCRNNAGISFRAEPTRGVDFFFMLDDGETVEIIANARVNGAFSEFIRVRHLETGTEGWVYSDCIGTNSEQIIGWMNVNLPVFEFSDMIPAENPVSEMIGVTNRQTYLKLYPDAWAAANLMTIPAGSSVRAVGRNACRYQSWCWFQVEYQGQIGWVGLFSTDFTENYLRLPITLQ